jgi:hypothetical protein
MRQKSFFLFLFQSALFLAFGTAFFPSIRLWAFAPFLALVFHRAGFLTSLWIAALSGLAVDLVSSQFSFGLFTLTHTCAAILSYGQKKHFFEDKTFPFCLYAALISFFLSGFLMLFSSFTDKQLSFTFPVAFIDLVIMPFADMAYAFLWFILPVNTYRYVRKQILLRKLAKEEA